MARLLFRLRGVPEEELAEILVLLEQHHIDVYETSAGNWGVSMPALWLNDEQQYDEARALLDDYQQDRRQRMRAEWQEEKQKGAQSTFLQVLISRPLATIALLAFCAAVLYFSVKPFLNLLKT